MLLYAGVYGINYNFKYFEQRVTNLNNSNTITHASYVCRLVKERKNRRKSTHPRKKKNLPGSYK